MAAGLQRKNAARRCKRLSETASNTARTLALERKTWEELGKIATELKMSLWFLTLHIKHH
jgi:predicted DNA-binding ribbon-helix-helix protein